MTWVLIIIIFFSLIRLEFNQQHQDYYTELDAVFLYGIPAPRLSSAEQKPPTSSTGANISLTARLLQKLSLKDDKDNSFQNGLFDILPVRLILLSSLWFLLVFFSCLTKKNYITEIFVMVGKGRNMTFYRLSNDSKYWLAL